MRCSDKCGAPHSKGEMKMRYIVGLIIGIFVGILLYILWKKLFGKYLPSEDSFLLRFIICSVYSVMGLICGCSTAASLKIDVFFASVLLMLVVIIITYCFGLYYKVIASKRMKF